MLLITKPRSGYAGVLCQVVRETPQRYYVEVVKRPVDDRRFYMADLLEGSRGNQYINKENVLMLDTDEETYDAYVRVWNDYEGRLADLRIEHRTRSDELNLARERELVELFAARP